MNLNHRSTNNIFVMDFPFYGWGYSSSFLHIFIWFAVGKCVDAVIFGRCKLEDDGNICSRIETGDVLNHARYAFLSYTFKKGIKNEKYEFLSAYTQGLLNF